MVEKPMNFWKKWGSEGIKSCQVGYQFDGKNPVLLN